mgnify:CR=1 FL=1
MCDDGPAVEQPAGDLEAGEPRHLHVEKHHDRGADRSMTCERFDAVAGLTDDLHAADLSEQVSQLVARELLVVHQHRFAAGRRCRLERRFAHR